ncbi:Na(+)/H(+) exchange regulatory cofactor NHE-RF1a isoform X1 [Osmerus eperlanus]|uniref:Na(+)/H(+) exchange regulatory cofactor NHE-RF1a isoform X1 n=1 Tax=Osmerus eperlanus TaxID=29151 RepID=UPI002E14464C
MSKLRPRLCILEKGADGYGFHLHGEKGKTGQFIRLVEPNSPAESAGMLAGDRLAFVNGENVEDESHQQVVARIRATMGALELIVVDAETLELLKKHNLKCRKEFAREGIPLPSNESNHGDDAASRSSRDSTTTPPDNGDVSLARLSVSSKDSRPELRPRLCRMKKGSTGYGFNLHSDKNKPGQYIRAVDAASPAEKAGLRPQDKIIQVNGVGVQDMQHSEVVGAIKTGGGETSLLVVDAETEAFFKSCNVLPTEAHLTGPLPQPAVTNGGASQPVVNGTSVEEPKPKVSVSSSSSTASSNTSLPTASSNTSLPAAVSSAPPPAEVRVQVARAPEPSLKADSGEPGLDLGLSLAQAKEKARQKRAAKKAPQMDWSKRNELFSNL